MTSKYTEVQDIYNKIKCLYSTIKDDDEKEIDLDLPLHYDLAHYIQTILGVEKTWFSNSINYNKPFEKNYIMFGDEGGKRRTCEIHDLMWGNNLYFIAFIDYGILISMSINMIKKIPILRSILLNENGGDKPMQLYYYNDRSNALIKKNEKGPNLYITKLPLDSLIFDVPTEDWNVRRMTDYSAAENPRLTTYFKYNNVEEALVNMEWY